MQVDVHDIEAQITRTAFAQHWVEVGTIVVHQATSLVNELGNLSDIVLKDTQGVGVGHHHTSDVLVEQGTQVVHIDGAIGTALNNNYFKATYSCTCRISAMSAVGDNNLHTVGVAIIKMIAAHNHQSGKLAMSTGIRVEGELAQARKLSE